MFKLFLFALCALVIVQGQDAEISEENYKTGVRQSTTPASDSGFEITIDSVSPSESTKLVNPDDPMLISSSIADSPSPSGTTVPLYGELQQSTMTKQESGLYGSSPIMAESTTHKMAESTTHKMGESTTHKMGESTTHKMGESTTHKMGESTTHKMGESSTKSYAGLSVSYTRKQYPATEAGYVQNYLYIAVVIGSIAATVMALTFVIMVCVWLGKRKSYNQVN